MSRNSAVGFAFFATCVLLASGATAQTARSTAPSGVCAAAGTYMQEIGSRRDAGASRGAAVSDVAIEFDALAANAHELADRRTVLAAGDGLASFAFALHGVEPKTLAHVGSAYCESHAGVLATPDTATTARIEKESLACQRKFAGSDAALGSCVEQTMRPVDLAYTAGRTANARSIKAAYEFAAAFGGDTIGTIQFTNGSEQKVKAGEGFTFGGGLVQHLNEQFGIKYMGGYKISFTAANNANVEKTAIVLDVIPYWRNGPNRVGFGITHHFSPQVDWDWLAPKTKFDDATGVTLEYAWRWFSFSYTDMDYQTAGVKLDASSFTFKFTSRY